ncbi:MAG: PAS domain-containing protein [Dehalococcoidia bacterium]
MAQREIELILLRATARALAIPIWLMGLDGRLLYYNEAAERILGKRFDEVGDVLGEELATLFQATAPDGSAISAEELPINIALQKQRPAHLPMRICGMDGVWRRIEVTSFPVEGAGGRHLGAVAIFWEVETT